MGMHVSLLHPPFWRIAAGRRQIELTDASSEKDVILVQYY